VAQDHAMYTKVAIIYTDITLQNHFNVQNT